MYFPFTPHLRIQFHFRPEADQQGKKEKKRKEKKRKEKKSKQSKTKQKTRKKKRKRKRKRKEKKKKKKRKRKKRSEIGRRRVPGLRRERSGAIGEIALGDSGGPSEIGSGGPTRQEQVVPLVPVRVPHT